MVLVFPHNSLQKGNQSVQQVVTFCEERLDGCFGPVQNQDITHPQSSIKFDFFKTLIKNS